MLVNKAPHPNAARIYINWLLSKEGQAEYAKATDVPSLRVDMPPDNMPSWRRPVPGYIEGYTEEAMAARDRLLPLLKEIMGK
jgi:ABC-type Fe3+ transport system substrate-binding protein